MTVLAAEPRLPYDRPPLSKGMLAGADVTPSFRQPGWYAEHRIELRLGATAQALDARRRIVTLAGGERVRYEDLLIATGAEPRALPALEGLANVHACGRCPARRGCARRWPPEVRSRWSAAA